MKTLLLLLCSPSLKVWSCLDKSGSFVLETESYSKRLMYRTRTVLNRISLTLYHGKSSLQLSACFYTCTHWNYRVTS